jgi:hypothetical protein
MSHAPFPLQPGSQVLDPARRPGFRLGDADKIAAVRLDTNGDGSLKEALAEFDGRGPPRDAVEHLASRIELAQAAYTPPIVSSTLPFAAEPAVANGEADEFAIPEWSDARAVMLAELHAQATAPEETQPTYWQPAARDTEPYAPPAASVAQPAAAMGPAPVAEPPLPEMPAKDDVVPIANALDAAAKLTADATATAAALENLTRLLEMHQRAASAMPAPQPVAQRQTPRPDSAMRPRPQPQSRAAASKPQSVARAINPPALRQQPQAREPQFDLRGFMAGFALSCAIGGVLYIYLI